MQKQVGVIGGGQLAQMMAIAAQKLGVELIVQTENPNEPAVKFAKRVDTLAELVANCDVITFENEFADLDELEEFAAHGAIFLPSIPILKILVDKYEQRVFLRAQGILVPDFFAINNQTELESASQALGFPLVIKTRRHGYDGKGTEIIHNQTELLSAWQKMGENNLLLEAFVPFERELAIMVARNEQGGMVLYPVVETEQKDQVCVRAIAPADISSEVKAEVENIAHQIATTLDLVGILGIELFLSANGKVLVNEIAPRVHNSAHYSIEGCDTSQFSQLVRISSGMHLGTPDLIVNAAVMVNLLGFEERESDYAEVRAKIAKLASVYVHWYEKDKSINGRKLGHVNVFGINREAALNLATEVENLWYGQNAQK